MKPRLVMFIIVFLLCGMSSGCSKKVFDESSECESIVNEGSPCYMRVINNCGEGLIVELHQGRNVLRDGEVDPGTCWLFGIEQGHYHVFFTTAETGRVTRMIEFDVEGEETYDITVTEDMLYVDLSPLD